MEISQYDLSDPNIPRFPNGSLPTSAYGWSELCIDNPRNDWCLDNVQNYYEYRIDLVPNIVFFSIFAASFIIFLLTTIVTRRAIVFTIALCLGNVCEILGYGGRIISWKNQWKNLGFMIQICCLTIGPAFLAAGLYLCLRRIVSAFGRENSPIPPKWYTRIFIPCDVVSLLLQGAGGGLAAVASQNDESPDLGTNIMIAGLAFQVFTVFMFIVASGLFAFRTYRRYRELGAAAFDQDPRIARIRNSCMFRLFLWALGLSTFLILWRSVFRVAELSEGWEGPLMKRQDIFIAFEGVLIVVAVVALNVFNPAFCCKNLMEDNIACWGKRRSSKFKEARQEDHYS